MLSAGVPLEFRNSRAVITCVKSSHCTACALDETGRFGAGECWPNFADVKLVSTTLRLGNRVVVDGCSGPQTLWLNGHAGTIVSNKRYGHPCFVHSKRHLSRPPQFNVCICLEQPPSPSERLVLIEPRFLFDFDQFTRQTTERLGAVVRKVSSSKLKTIGNKTAFGQRRLRPMKNGSYFETTFVGVLFAAVLWSCAASWSPTRQKQILIRPDVVWTRIRPQQGL